MDYNVKLYLNVGAELEDTTMYRKIIGSLIYLMKTCLDLAFYVVVLSRFMQNPRRPHLHVVQRVLRYSRQQLAPDYSLLCRYRLPKLSKNLLQWLHKRSEANANRFEARV
ncbi:hypothetical protein E3N88_36845 [Mikania micrantha]|uniref:Reverse transcriptase Ty1/copia-type domain-containing protein n=1 Tax=Mikania micrantha TaxID=192012 RepID=A0A5N6M4Y4_9ASTR|nr:hypothetical protein E3N88_36845 [Mikania micrantha]